MPFRVSDRTLDQKLDTLRAKMKPAPNRKALVVAILNEACDRAKATKDPYCWRNGR